jgi:hypothetical protein
MKLNTKAKVGTTKKTASHVISVRVDENEYNICSKLATDEQRTMSQMGRILLQKGLADVVADKNIRRAKA